MLPATRPQTNLIQPDARAVTWPDKEARGTGQKVSL
jgi:hypothetical protein